MKTGEEQYLELAYKATWKGRIVKNERTNQDCSVIIGESMIYDTSKGHLPVLTTKKTFWKPAIAEMLGYLRGYNNAAQFRKLGCNTWDANANENVDWLCNPYRKGTDDMGYCYGQVGSKFRKPDGGYHNQWLKVIFDLTKGYDDRSEIVTFWHPGSFDEACLKPCMHTHTFSLVNDDLYLNSAQRSADVPLGLPFNMIQVSWLLMIVAQITGTRPAQAKHDLVNCHLYQDQIAPMRDCQLLREPFEEPILKINPDIKTWHDLMTWVTLDDFQLENYRHHMPIKYAFSVQIANSISAV